MSPLNNLRCVVRVWVWGRPAWGGRLVGAPAPRGPVWLVCVPVVSYSSAPWWGQYHWRWGA